jgi:NAD(P)-dependent dehydrogenase (short-subunit alcohol dehydrogenase family)/acetyltransferase-like isoleucine patch superfamily enzyme
MSGWYAIDELRRQGVTVHGQHILVSKFVNIYNPKNLILHDHIRIDDFTVISCKGTVEIFNHVHIGHQCMISSSTRIVFGNYTGISSGVKLFGGCDDFSGDFLTNPTVPSKYSNVETGEIILEDHALVGASTIILPNVVLREGTAIGALSLVKKSTEPWKMYVGSPIKYMKDRKRRCLDLQKELELEEQNQTVEIRVPRPTILITGGSRGIGRMIAQHFNKLNYTVIITYYKSVSQAKELESEGIIIYKMDVTNYTECESVIHNIINRVAKIDVLVNNAGIIENKLFHKMSSDSWNSVIDTNVNSLYNVTRNVIQNMMDHSNGRIINISSISGLKGSIGQTNYSSSKHAVIGFTKSMALEYGKSNILVNCICPGLVSTDMINNINPKYLERIVNSNPIPKIIAPVEIAKACEFFVNSDYCTGTIMNIDCGMNC